MKKIGLLICLINILPNIFGQVEQMIIPSDLKQQTIVTEPATLRKGFCRIGTSSSWGAIDRVFNSSGKRSYIFGSYGSGWATSWYHELDLQYGITDRLQVTAQIPYRREKIYYASEIIVPAYDSSEVEYYEANGNGLGDISLSASYQILKEDTRKPSLVGKLFITLPTGRKNPTNIIDSKKFDRPTGYGETTLDVRFQLRKIFYPYSVTIYTAYLYHFKGKKIFNPGEDEVSFESGDIFYIGGSYDIHLNDWIVLGNEAAFFKWWDDKFYGPTVANVGLTGRWVINYQPSLVFQIRRFRFFEVIQFPVFGHNVAADPQYIIGLQYVI
jgi:hypothetical protein